MRIRNVTSLSLAVAALGGMVPLVSAEEEIPYTDNFFLRLGPRGVNNYFIPLKPRSFLLFKGEEEGKAKTLLISVL